MNKNLLSLYSLSSSPFCHCNVYTAPPLTVLYSRRRQLACSSSIRGGGGNALQAIPLPAKNHGIPRPKNYCVCLQLPLPRNTAAGFLYQENTAAGNAADDDKADRDCPDADESFSPM